MNRKNPAPIKSSFIMAAIAVIVLAAACNNKSQKEAAAHMDKIESTLQENTPPGTDQKAGAATTPSPQSDDIFGEWELVGSIVDTNDNLLIDEEERKMLKQASYKDYMTLNRDGTGLFTIGRMEGKYELTDKDGKGKQYLTWYDKGNGRHRVGTILSVTKDEMQIREPGGSGLFLWKRL